MTSKEVNEFVQLEVASRYKDISDTARSDWVRAVWKAGNLDTARQIIRELVDNPTTKLCCKAFHARRLELERRATQGRVGGAKSIPPAYSAWIRCMQAPADHPSWQDREWVRLDGRPSSMCGDKAWMLQYAHDKAKEIQAAYGGAWTGVVRPDGQLPINHPDLMGEPAKEWAFAHILDGPDSPGRRFIIHLREKKERDLAKAVAESLPQVPEVTTPKTATRELIERLKAMPPVPSQGPTRFDPEADPALFDTVTTATREPGEGD